MATKSEEVLGDLVEDARSAAERAGEALSAAGSHAVETGETIIYDAEDFIIHRPWLSMLIATSVGILIGALARPVRYPAPAPARTRRPARRRR